MENIEELNLPSALDTLNRNDYKSESAYLEAAADLEIKRSTPEFRKAYSQAKLTYAQREFERRGQERLAQLKQEAAKIHLSYDEDRSIRERTSNEVAQAVRSGEIDPADMQEEIEKRYNTYSTAETKRKANRVIMNGLIRDAAGVTPTPPQSGTSLNDALHQSLGR